MRIKKGIKKVERKLRWFTNGSRYVCIPKDWINPNVEKVRVMKAEVVEELPLNAIVIIPIEGSS